MIILFAGLVACLFIGYNAIGGFSEVTFAAERLQVIDFNWGFSKGEEYGIAPMIIGGFFLYASYYGCDQTQAQRMLSAKNEGTIVNFY